jgi:hypothetical protein
VPNTFTDAQVWAIIFITVISLVISFFLGYGSGRDRTDLLTRKYEDIRDSVRTIEGRVGYLYTRSYEQKPSSPTVLKEIPPYPYDLMYRLIPTYYEKIEKKPTIEGRLKRIERELYETPITKPEQV